MCRRPSPEIGPARAGRRRPWLRRLSALLLVLGTLVAVDAILTVVWMEPVTAALQAHRQSGLERRFAVLPVPAAAPADLPDDRARLTYLARRSRNAMTVGAPVARLRVPRAAVDQTVVFGTGPAPLRDGPGFFPGQPVPGARGTTAIAGHRTTYGAPFRHLDRLRRGDAIRVDTQYGRFEYRTTRLARVDTRDLRVLRDTGHDTLVLSTCDPPFSATRRLIVFARLERATVRGAARTRATR